MPDLVTIKVTQDTRTMLRLLAAHSEEDMCEVAERLSWAEMKRKKIAPSEILKRAVARFERDMKGK